MTELAQLLTPSIDTTRYVIIAAIAVALLLYSRAGIGVGGTLTSGYLILLALREMWIPAAVLIAVSVAAYLIAKTALTRWAAVSRATVSHALIAASVLSAGAVLAAAALHGGINVGGGSLMLAGSLIIPGVLAYDASRQGLRWTVRGTAAAVAGTALLTVPVVALANVLVPQARVEYLPTNGMIEPGTFWLATLVVVLAGWLLHQAGLRTGGFIGALMLVEFLSVEAFLTVGLAAVATHLLTRALAARIPLTPRQRFHVAMLLGAIVAWTSLYWASLTGWLPAVEANQYAIEPLLAVGLLAADMGRAGSGVMRTLAGAAAAAGAAALTVLAAQAGTAAGTVAAALIATGLAVAVVVTVTVTERADARTARDAGRRAAARHRPIRTDRLASPGKQDATTPTVSTVTTVSDRTPGSPVDAETRPGVRGGTAGPTEPQLAAAVAGRS